MELETRQGYTVSLQISDGGNIEAGRDFSLGGKIFYLKNISGDTLADVEIVLASGKSFVTNLESGWNCEMVKQVNNAPAGLQWGY